MSVRRGMHTVYIDHRFQKRSRWTSRDALAAGPTTMSFIIDQNVLKCSPAVLYMMSSFEIFQNKNAKKIRGSKNANWFPNDKNQEYLLFYRGQKMRKLWKFRLRSLSFLPRNKPNRGRYVLNYQKWQNLLVGLWTRKAVYTVYCPYKQKDSKILLNMRTFTIFLRFI